MGLFLRRILAVALLLFRRVVEDGEFYLAAAVKLVLCGDDGRNVFPGPEVTYFLFKAGANQLAIEYPANPFSRKRRVAITKRSGAQTNRRCAR